jgi:hypothetical protein
MRSVEECKRILSKIGFKLGVAPNLISMRLLSDEDKKDMLEGLLEIDELEASVEVWRHNGMPDYAQGSLETYEAQKNRLKFEESLANHVDNPPSYRKPFIDYRMNEE